MPKSPKTKTAKRGAKPLQLEVLDPARFPGRESAQRFIRSETFDLIVETVYFGLAPWGPDGGDGGRPLTSEAAQVASLLCWDVKALSRAAIGSGAWPGAERVHCFFRAPEKLEGLIALSRSLACGEAMTEEADFVLGLAELARCEAQADAAREAA